MSDLSSAHGQSTRLSQKQQHVHMLNGAHLSQRISSERSTGQHRKVSTTSTSTLSKQGCTWTNEILNWCRATKGWREMLFSESCLEHAGQGVLWKGKWRDISNLIIDSCRPLIEGCDFCGGEAFLLTVGAFFAYS